MNPLDDLLGALNAAPALAGARCSGHHELWDETDDPAIVEYTRDICTTRCPVFDRCHSWLESLPKSRRPPGVVAGELYRAQ